MGNCLCLGELQKPAPPPTKVVYNTNACGIGTIIRYWEVEDPHWVIQKCSQTITVIGVQISPLQILAGPGLHN